jgi:glycerate kinase
MKTIPSPRRALNVLIAPSGFKESLSAEEVADRIAEGVLDTMPGARVTKLPMADGGEGFTQALVNATGGTLRPVRVTGPVGAAVDAFFGLLGGRTSQTAVIEMAAAAGLRLVPRDRRNPMLTTSRGVGELIRAALDAGAPAFGKNRSCRPQCALCPAGDTTQSAKACWPAPASHAGAWPG